MKIWLLTQSVTNSYYTYDSAVVAAENEEEARRVSPDEAYVWGEGGWHFYYLDGTKRLETRRRDWPDEIDRIEVTLLGEAAEGITAGLIMSSFNAE